jgi:hypothetical protein
LTTSEKAEKPRAYKRADIQYLDEDELARLFAAIQSGGDAMHLAIFHVALHRGLRASEVGRFPGNTYSPIRSFARCVDGSRSVGPPQARSFDRGKVVRFRGSA